MASSNLALLSRPNDGGRAELQALLMTDFVDLGVSVCRAPAHPLPVVCGTGTARPSNESF